MGFSRFFIVRPIFAIVVSLFITIIGAISYAGLPVTQFPEITPPTISVNASYPGASAQTVADATPCCPASPARPGKVWRFSRISAPFIAAA